VTLPGSVRERILLPLGKGQVAEGEVEGLLRGTERALIGGADQILLVSDSQAGLKAILSTSPRAGQFRAIQYDSLVRAAMVTLPALHITNLWTPAHIGTVGNEFADDAAKAATLLAPPPSVPVSLTTCKRSINVVVLEKWKVSWKMATPGRGLREIDDSPPSLILRSPYQSSASRADISILSQLRTNFSQLNAHPFKCRLTPSAACDACGAASETRAHFLLHCPAWESLRPPLQAASYSAGILCAVDVRTILNHPKLLKPTIHFINLTNRFR
jgi:ribonuclease HI